MTDTAKIRGISRAPSTCQNPTQLHNQNHTLQVKLNRLTSRKAVLENHLKKSSTAHRRARTRTLIQMGAILTLTDIPTLLGIEEGDDLQYDIHTMDKASTLLGIILSLREHLPSTLSDTDVENFKKIGIRQMKRQKISSVTQKIRV